MVNANCKSVYNSLSRFQRARISDPIRLGYVRLLDAAPIIIAESLGMFLQEGLNVKLSREVGWATIRDKLVFGELDVVQALCPMPYVMQMGINVKKTKVITGMVLNSNGNAITLSNHLRKDGVTSGTSLRKLIKKKNSARKLVFGVVSLFSSHHFSLCRWLENHGINPHRDVIISVLPPDQMVRNMKSGNIDGFCVGEPWNSLAVENEIGWCPTTSSEISKGYPEKVLATTERFNSYRADEYIKLIQVLLEACKYCDCRENHSEIINILSRPEYLNFNNEILSKSFSSKFNKGFGKHSSGSIIKFSGANLNSPDFKSALQIYKDLVHCVPNLINDSVSPAMIPTIFSETIYYQATSLTVN